MRGLTDVENPPFGANTLTYTAQFFTIETNITLGMCLNGKV